MDPNTSGDLATDEAPATEEKTTTDDAATDTDALLSALREGIRLLDSVWVPPAQERLVALFRKLDDALVNGEPLPEDWQGERDGYVTGHYGVTDDPEEQE